MTFGFSKKNPMANLIMGAVMIVSASAYTPSRCEGGPMAADGCLARPNYTLAVSRDLKHLLGKWLHIEGIGWRKAHDVMGPKAKQSVDVCMSDREKALEFGRRKVAVKVIR